MATAEQRGHRLAPVAELFPLQGEWVVNLTSSRYGLVSLSPWQAFNALTQGLMRTYPVALEQTKPYHVSPAW